jgi:hypothetical protein
MEKGQDVGESDLGWRSPEQREQPLGSKIGNQTVVEREEDVGGEAALGLRETMTPLSPKRSKKGVFGVEPVPSLQLLPELFSGRRRWPRKTVLVNDESPIAGA